MGDIRRDRTPQVRGISGMFPFKPVKPGILTHDRDVVGGLACIHTPGHTPGNYCYLDRDGVPLRRSRDGLPEREDKRPLSRFTPDMKETNRSIGKRERLDFELFLSGHGEPITSGGNLQKPRNSFKG
jgi:glyoxylase-like metal-dependent hydrolase (beta-lactamase superfamily II)